MAHTRGDGRRALGLGAAIAVLVALACLAYAGSRDARPLSLAELSRTETLLMSCDESATSSAEPLWCADPSAPQCAPAAPDAPHVLLAGGPNLWLQPLALPTSHHAYVVMPWPKPRTESVLARIDQARLERPPRA